MSAGQLWECADGANRETAVRGAVAAMRRGGLVILPTENSYVVAADAFSLRGTALLRRAKMVPESTPLGLLVASPVVVSGVAARVPRVAKKLMEAFCARRPCSRLSVKAPWLPTRSDPGEAAG